MNGMSVVSKVDQGVSVELDVQMSSRLLERALRSNVSVSLAFSRCDNEVTASAQIERGQSETLMLSGEESTFEGLLPSSCLEIRFTLDAQEFFFSSSVLSCTERTVEIARPAQLHTWQRRRFLRARVAESATVTLTLPDVYTHPKGEGAILNVSRDGLACRVSRELADSLSVDETVGVVFELGPDRIRIECNGKVKSKTVSGSAHSTIVGVHFKHGSGSVEMDEQLARLLSP